MSTLHLHPSQRPTPFAAVLFGLGLTLGSLVLGSLVLAGPAAAGSSPPPGFCAPDVVPAATLLVPYFEVDLDDPQGRTTQVYFHNASPDPTLVHVTFWTDWGLPTLDFDVFLTGYDVETLDLTDIFHNQNLPITSDAQSDPNDTISPHGSHPEWDGSFPECENFFPFFINPLLVGSIYERVVNGHTGQGISSLGGDCLGESHGDNVARGSITLDVVNRCSVDFPSDVSYWGGSDPVLSTANRIFGDVYYLDGNAGTISGMPAVHLQADPSFDALSSPTGATFYGRFATGGVDHREPLPSTWGIGLDPAAGPTGEAELVVWRDPTVGQVGQATCGSGPDWKDLPVGQVACFDHQETVLASCVFGEPCSPLTLQTVAAQDVFGASAVGGNWCYLDLSVDDSGVANDVDFPGPGGTFAQAWVGRIARNGASSTSAAHRGVALASICDPLGGPSPPVIDIFLDGFETGNLARWSASVP